MAAQVEIEDQPSITELDNGEILDPLSSSSSTSDSTILLREGNQEHDVITTCFLSGLGPPTSLANATTIVAIRKKSPNTITTRAKHLSFRIFTEAIARKNGGDPNVRYGWYVGSREQIERIVTHGFSSREIDSSSAHGIGVHLVPSKFSLSAAEATEEDEEGLRHLLLCRLILGKPEEIISGSKQTYPSSVEFDSGVDDLQNPRKYIIWSSTMNSYILPTYIVTFKSPRLTVISSPARRISPRVSFAALMSMLAKSMDASRMNLIMRTYDDFRKRKIQRDQLVRKMREVAGDNLLAQIIKTQGQGLNRKKVLTCDA